MPLIPIFKPYPREQLAENFNLNLGLSEWVAIEFKSDAVQSLDPNFDAKFIDENDHMNYETNRYDAEYYDAATGHNLTVYVYMDEHSEQVLAIDSVVSNAKNLAVYNLFNTPLGEMVQTIQAPA